jgi:hypothetical protein
LDAQSGAILIDTQTSKKLCIEFNNPSAKPIYLSLAPIARNQHLDLHAASAKTTHRDFAAHF